MDVTWIGSPSFDAGRVDRPGNHNRVELIVIHYIVGTLADADRVFTDPAAEVSAHFAIDEGSIHQYVKEEDTAWHAGDFTINTRSIGIEHSAFWDPDADEIRPPDESTMAASIELCLSLCTKYGLDPEVAIVPHQQFTETLCPGTVDYLYIRDGVRRRLLQLAGATP